MNTKIIYKWTGAYNENMPDNNFESETNFIITDGIYDLTDYIRERAEKDFEEDDQCEGFYWIVEDGERTGEAYMVVAEQATDEDLTW